MVIQGFRRQPSTSAMCAAASPRSAIAPPWRPPYSIASRPNFECGYTASRGRARAHLHSENRLGQDDARHISGDRCGQVRRQGRHRRLLPGRQRRLPRRLQARWACLRRRAIYGGAIAKNADLEAEGADASLPISSDQDQSIPLSDVEIVKGQAAGRRGPHLPRRPRLLLRTKDAAATTRPHHREALERTTSWLSQIYRVKLRATASRAAPRRRTMVWSVRSGPPPDRCLEPDPLSLAASSTTLQP